MRKHFKAGLVAALGVTVVMAPQVAFAGSNSDWSYTDLGANGAFFHDGDYIQICDIRADGWSVYAQYQINGGGTNNTSMHNGGAHTCANKSTGNPAEGASVVMRSAADREWVWDGYGPWRSGRA